MKAALITIAVLAGLAGAAYVLAPWLAIDALFHAPIK